MTENGFKRKLTAIFSSDIIERDKYNLTRIILVLPLSISGILYLLLEGIYPKVCFSHDIRVPIHQYIALEAREVWERTPDELKQHMHTDFNSNLDEICEVSYGIGDDIITGSAEEDIVAAPLELIGDIDEFDVQFGCLPKCDDEGGYFKHFWDPDLPSVSGYKCNTIGGGYNSGLVLDSTNTDVLFQFLCGNYDSAYRLAQDYWDRLVIPYYTGKTKNGQPHLINKDRAYYWLGRIAHLITDMCVPAHVHNDPHSVLYPHGDDSFEDYMKEPGIVYQFEGSFYAGEQYNYEELKWEGVHENQDPPNLFWLFWYVAQKTQYFASDGNTGKNVTPFMGKDEYTKLDGTKVRFSPNLWQKEITKGDIALDDIITNPYDLEYPSTGIPNDRNLQKVANALIPHAMKAVAGLYRLFWIETHPKTKPISPILFLLLSDASDCSISQWANRYGGLFYESTASSVQSTSDGSYAVAGETWSFGSGSAGVRQLKLSSNGTIEWQKT